MALPGNGIFVVRGEMLTLMTAMKRGARWNSTSYMDEEKDGLLKLFVELKQILSKIEDLRLIDPIVFLAPFLEVIRTEETTGAVTSLALSAVNKFLSYGLIDPTHSTLSSTVENIADAVTHAKFMGTDQSSDGVTLMRVVEVLHTLMRSPEGNALTNESVCEVMLSCFKICFEPRLNELLRRTAEQALKDMVLLLFMRLPQFSEDSTQTGLAKKFKMIAATMDQGSIKKRKTKTEKQELVSKPIVPRINEMKVDEKIPTSFVEDPQSPQTDKQVLKVAKFPVLATTPATPAGTILDMQGKITQTPKTTLMSTKIELNHNNSSPLVNNNVDKVLNDDTTIDVDIAASQVEETTEEQDEGKEDRDDGEYVNSVGVRFTQQNSIDEDGPAVLLPYGLPCIQELFRFLILLCNPLDKQNTDTMIHMGLSLLKVAFEVGADNIGKYETLLFLVKDDLCRYLFSLMHSERLTIFAADLQLCFLLFESLRMHLKLQLEAYLTKLSEIITSDNPKTPYEMRELALDNIVQLWRVPGFVAELYINFDCDLYCSDLFENMTKLLAKYTLSATNVIYSTHILAMDALISVIENIEKNCVSAKTGKCSSPPSNRHSRNNSDIEGIIIDRIENESVMSNYGLTENISKFINNSTRNGALNNFENISKEQLKNLKSKKRILTQGTELFNQRPDKGIQYLQENGILNSSLDPKEVAIFLRHNPGLDKKMIGEYISKKKNVESKILEKFVESFDFQNLRVDQALRLYLETFRLPGEAPLIFLVMEHFADHWHKQHNEPFANTDAAFRLAYSIIMLNMDQHNHNAKRLNVPMTPEDFLKNLRGLNGNQDFDQEMLLNVFNSIKNEEIIMPAEQTGLVRENYQWKVLLRRGSTKDGLYHHVNDASYDQELFNIIWGPSLSALGFIFDKSNENSYERTLAGFTKCAGISAFYNLHEDFDGLVLTLCKFTTLLNLQLDGTNEITLAVHFGLNQKAQSSIKTVFGLVHDYGDCMRESWKNILEVVVQLFRLKLLPKSMIEVEDFCESNGKAVLVLHKPSQKSESGLFSSLYSYLSSEGQREPTYEEVEIIKVAKKCIKNCQIDQMVQGSKFVQYESLQELLKAILLLVKPPNVHKSVGLPFSDDITVFWMEFLVNIVIQNRDRMIPLWNCVRDQMYLLLMGSSSCGYDYLLNRTIVGLLKLAIYLMRNEELCPMVLQSLKMILMLKPNIIYRISRQISSGIYELLKTSAQNIHNEADWQIIFTILECVGAGAAPKEFEDSLPIVGTKSDGGLSSEEDSVIPDRGYISDSEVLHHSKTAINSTSSTPFPSPTTENWILISKDSDLCTASRPQSPPLGSSLVYSCKLMDHLPFSLFKCWDSLAFIVRNVAHITPFNFESCVRCIRTFVEASLDGGFKGRTKLNLRKLTTKKKKEGQKNKKKDENSSDSEDEELCQRYETLSIQLLDLMYTLYTRTAQIFRWWAEEGCAVPQCSALWAQGWCPLLQGIARLAMDRRREVRTYAISCLQQRALLVHDLQTLSGNEWCSCFRQVLFPLLHELLPESPSIIGLEPVLLEESRIRTATIMSKVFLHHLTPLIELQSFNELWLEILDYIEKFMKVGSDMLYEQMLEILKNVLLVMHSVRVFHYNDGAIHSPLWDLTWKRIGEFLPTLKEDLFQNEVNRAQLMTPHSNRQMSRNFANVLPQVTVLPQKADVNSELIVAGIKNTNKSSIILQPQGDSISQSFTLEKVIQNQPNIPILIPQASIASQHNNVNSSVTPSVTLPMCISSFPQIVQPIPIPEATPIDLNELENSKSTIDNISNKTNLEQIEFANNAETQLGYHSEFSIEFPDSPTAQFYDNNDGGDEKEENYLQNTFNASNQTQYYSHNQFEEPKTTDTISQNNFIRNDDPPVPISHLITANQYPSQNKIPPQSIVQSFAPVYIQTHIPQVSGSDIYTDYAQNPYNLTLQQTTENGNVPVEDFTINRQEVSSMFQSSNYFSGNVDPSTIPPGSEMLFGQP